MTINLLSKIYESWINKNKINLFCSADELMISDEIKTDEQKSWLKRFIYIWEKCEDLEYQRYWKRKEKQNEII